jgi:hypothetical protein
MHSEDPERREQELRGQRCPSKLSLRPRASVMWHTQHAPLLQQFPAPTVGCQQ